MNKIINKIREKRNIKESSIMTYKSSLSKVEKILGKPLKLKQINQNKLMLEIAGFPITTRKNIITSIIVALDAYRYSTEPFSSVLKKEDQEYKKFLKSQVKTKSQKENWITVDEINKVLKNLNREATIIMKSEPPYSRNDIQALNNYFIILFLSNHHVRLDLADVHLYLKGAELEKSNWLIKNKKWEYHLYKFKTSNQYELPLILEATKEESYYINFIKKFKEDGDPIIANKQNKKFSRAALSNKIRNIFEKQLRTKRRIGVSILRHVYASEILKDEKSIIEREKIAEAFQHSPQMTQLYRKI